MGKLNYRATLDKVWVSNSTKTDWLGLESMLRAILVDQSMEQGTALLLIDEAVAAYTGRGSSLSE